MTYTFSGQFHGELAPGFVEALSNATVRLYRYRGTKYITSLAVSDPVESMQILTFDAISAKASALLGEATTDAAGNFVVTLDPASGYNGEAFEVDLFLPDLPFRKTAQPHAGLQLSLTTMKPRWEATTDGFAAGWEYTIPTVIWSDIHSRFDAWVVCGQVIATEGAMPLPGVRVTAYDADWLQDDCLGSATTDAAGKFRIDYARADFLRTPLSPLINYEEGGPDLYFRVESPTGELLLQEVKTAANGPTRANVSHCTHVQLAIEHALVPA
ncbi:MAG: hypothetical protein KDE19_07635 [Caldilineaceae bacterium]|nr:hypothetical protein [Caldilineaceae bacterium]